MLRKPRRRCKWSVSRARENVKGGGCARRMQEAEARARGSTRGPVAPRGAVSRRGAPPAAKAQMRGCWKSGLERAGRAFAPLAHAGGIDQDQNQAKAARSARMKGRGTATAGGADAGFVVAPLARPRARRRPIVGCTRERVCWKCLPQNPGEPSHTIGGIHQSMGAWGDARHLQIQSRRGRRCRRAAAPRDRTRWRAARVPWEALARPAPQKGVEHGRRDAEGPRLGGH